MFSRIAAVALSLLAAPAVAQDRVPQGIGFAQAGEGTWLCRHEDPFEALSCAQELCAEQVIDQECLPTAWCYPAGWSGQMNVWLPEFHSTAVLCGMPSPKALVDTLQALCAANESAVHCDLSRTIDPAGNERAVEGVRFAGGAPAPTPPPSDAPAAAPPATPDGDGVDTDRAPVGLQ